jgi:hypothetical protein
MEDILEIYAQEADPLRPRICFDEHPCLMVGDIIAPIPMKEGKTKKIDFEYIRTIATVVLLAYNMDTGQRHTLVCDTRTKIDYAHFIKTLLVQHYPEALCLRLVQDNLNTHTKGAFYKAFDPKEALQLTKRLEFHYTPKHGSWLNMAEIEFSALSRQCLNRRLPNTEKLISEVKAWEEQRNSDAVKIHWSFTTDKAQEVLARHYYEVFNNY